MVPKFLETYYPPQLVPDKTESLSSLVSTRKMVTYLKNKTKKLLNKEKPRIK